MASLSESHDIELQIKRTPESVRAWWTNLPEDYQATDPREDPFRIVTLQKLPAGRELLTYWHNDDGSVDQRTEIMRINSDGSWTVEMTDDPRFHFHDTFTVRAAKDRTILTIHQVITAKDPSSAGRIPKLKKGLVEFFTTMAEICERDAP